MEKILIIQTAFIGDLILATAFVDCVKEKFPDSEIHFLCRKGNEKLLENHPFIKRVWIWDKSKGKIKKLLSLIPKIRKEGFGQVFNLHRFASSGLLTAFSGAKETHGFKKNPLSIFFKNSVSHKIPHHYKGDFLHEVQRNRLLLNPLPTEIRKPRLFPSQEEVETVKRLVGKGPYIVLAPASVWATKAWPKEKWIALANKLPPLLHLYFIGSASDQDLCEAIIQESRGENLAGQLNLLESQTLMRSALRLYCNDSAPMHLASSANCPTTAIFCSTDPHFGFGPLANRSKCVKWEGACCSIGIHGHRACPKGHFDCGNKLDADKVFSKLDSYLLNLQAFGNLEHGSEAVAVLKRGGVLLCETETVPGLSVDARNEESVQKVIKLKERPPEKGFVILCSDWEMANRIVHLPRGEKFEKVRQLEKAITHILPAKDFLNADLLGLEGTLGLRVVKQTALAELIKNFGGPIISSSANVSGKRAPRFMEEVSPEIYEAVDGFWAHGDWGMGDVELREPSVLLRWKEGEVEVLRGRL